jgi:DNA-binding NarL/FixJ family response regulator
MSESLQKARILIVDDHPLFREGLRQIIERDATLVVCGEASTAAEAMQSIPQLNPDLVLVDISLAGTSGIDLIKEIKENFDALPVLVISMHDESLYAERSLRAGSKGYVMKHELGKTVKNAIHKVLSGGIYLSEKMNTAVISKLMYREDEGKTSPAELLSDREWEVFRMLGQGKGSPEIALELKVNVATVHSFRHRIREKLQLKTPSELMLYAIQFAREETPK